jgi:hypothetical protein
MIGHHFSASALTSSPSTSGVCRSRGKISSPDSTRRDRTAGSASVSITALLSLSMMSRGVPFGAKSPFHTEKEIAGSIAVPAARWPGYGLTRSPPLHPRQALPPGLFSPVQSGPEGGLAARVGMQGSRRPIVLGWHLETVSRCGWVSGEQPPFVVRVAGQDRRLDQPHQCSQRLP